MKNGDHKVVLVRNLSPSAFILQFERNDLDFLPGQYLKLGLPDESHRREYSVYSPLSVNHVEVLVREIPEGYVSPKLRGLRPGDRIAVDGPYGHFVIDRTSVDQRSFYLVATGTGIAPFHCFVHSYPRMDYQIIHGIRCPEDCYEHTRYPEDRYTACISKPSAGDFSGRVTDFLCMHPPSQDGLFYLCGNADMIYEVFDLLQQQGISRHQVFTEVYY